MAPGTFTVQLSTVVLMEKGRSISLRRIKKSRDLLVPSILVLSDDAKETVLLVGNASGKKDSARLREKIPQSIKLQRRSIRPHQRLDEIAADRIVIIDSTVAEIADPQPVLHESKSPWGIELTV